MEVGLINLVYNNFASKLCLHTNSAQLNHKTISKSNIVVDPRKTPNLILAYFVIPKWRHFVDSPLIPQQWSNQQPAAQKRPFHPHWPQLNRFLPACPAMTRETQRTKPCWPIAIEIEIRLWNQLRLFIVLKAHEYFIPALKELISRIANGCDMQSWVLIWQAGGTGQRLAKQRTVIRN